MSENPNEGGGSLLYKWLVKPRRPYVPATREPVGTATPAPEWTRYLSLDDGVTADDFAEPQQYRTVPRPLTGSSSSVVDGANWYYEKEVNPVRSANNALEKSMPTTEQSMGSGVLQVPKNIWSGLQVLTSEERRKKLDQDSRALFPFLSVLQSGGPKAIFDEGTGAVKDTFWDVLYDPLAHFRRIPYKTARVASVASTPQEEYDRLDENVHERFEQLKFKMGTSFITGGLLSYALKQQILKTGMRGAPVLATLAGLSLFSIKSLGAFSEVIGEVSQVKRTMTDASEGHHFDKRLQARAKGTSPTKSSSADDL